MTKKNKYVDFIEDEDFEKVVANLVDAYNKTKVEFTEKKFYKNQVDPIKFIFDSKLFGQSDEEKVKAEISRKMDKTVTNAIGKFHEEMLGKINGYTQYSVGNGYDIKADDDSLYADIKNKYNTVTGTHLSNLYSKISSYVEESKNPDARGYWVQIISNGASFNEEWHIGKEKKKNHKIYKISGDQFYKLLTGKDDAFYQVCKALPKAIDNVLKSKGKMEKLQDNISVFDNISKHAKDNNVDMITEMMNHTFKNYLGFKQK